MKCPSCGAIDDKVIDSRLGKDNSVIRRRRQCLSCNMRFTTYERVEEILPMVIKKDNKRENFERRKIIEGIQRACHKREVSVDKIEAVADSIERELMEMPEKEISTAHIGERVMKALQQIDDVAYVRFASVYRSFRDIQEFMDELKELYDTRKAREQRRSENGSPEDHEEIQNSPRSGKLHDSCP